MGRAIILVLLFIGLTFFLWLVSAVLGGLGDRELIGAPIIAIVLVVIVGLFTRPKQQI